MRQAALVDQVPHDSQALITARSLWRAQGFALIFL
jgi:hypothetical protein